MSEAVETTVIPDSIPQEDAELIKGSDAILAQFLSFMSGESKVSIIETEDQYIGAEEVIRIAKEYKKSLEDSYDKVVKPLYKDYKEAAAPYKCINLIKNRIDNLESVGRVFRRKQKAIEEEKQRQLQLEAEKQRQKLEEKAVKGRAKAEEYRESGNVAKAIEADSRADTIESLAASTVTPIVQSNIPKSTRGGFSTRKKYAALIKDFNSVLQYFIDYGIPPKIQDEMQKWADSQARNSRGMKSTIPDVEFYEE